MMTEAQRKIKTAWLDLGLGRILILNTENKELEIIAHLPENVKRDGDCLTVAEFSTLYFQIEPGKKFDSTDDPNTSSYEGGRAGDRNKTYYDAGELDDATNRIENAAKVRAHAQVMDEPGITNKLKEDIRKDVYRRYSVRMEEEVSEEPEQKSITDMIKDRNGKNKESK